MEYLHNDLNLWASVWPTSSHWKVTTSLGGSNLLRCLWAQRDYQISCKVSGGGGSDTNLLCLIWGGEMYFPADSPEICDLCDIKPSQHHLPDSGDKMSLRIMWLPLRYKEVNYILWFIIWKLKTHSFSNLIPSPMEKCSLWAKLANNVANSNADEISIQVPFCGWLTSPWWTVTTSISHLSQSLAIVTTADPEEGSFTSFDGLSVLPWHDTRVAQYANRWIFAVGPGSTELYLHISVKSGEPFPRGMRHLLTCIITAACCNTKSHGDKSAVRELI